MLITTVWLGLLGFADDYIIAAAVAVGLGMEALERSRTPLPPPAKVPQPEEPQ